MDTAKREDIAEKSILLTPLVIAFLWMAFTVGNLVFAPQKIQNEKLSPLQVDGLVTALFIFIVGYSIILGFLFYKMNKKIQEIKASKPTKPESKQLKKPKRKTKKTR